MSWINSRQFQISNRNGRHYVFRRNSSGNTEINIPAHIVSKVQAIAWLKAHPNKVANPTRFKPKRGAPQPGGLKPFERMVNGKKMVAFINKEGKEYFRPAPGPEPNYLVNIWRTQGKNVPWKFTCDILKKGLKKMSVLGRGRQGIVFLGSRYSNGRHAFAIKISPKDLRAVRRKEQQPAEVEFAIQSAAAAAAPDGVVKVHQLMQCENFVAPNRINMSNLQNSAHFDKSKQHVILMEYAAGGSLKDWISKQQDRLNDGMVHHIISSIVGALSKIQAKFPEFRHNDLHLENVFVADRGFLIGDFGWARIQKTGTNPAVNTAMPGTVTVNKYGVGPKTDPRYDTHMFLGELRDVLKRLGGPARFPLAMAFLDVAIPMGYRGANDVHTREGRLKYEDPCPGLPTLAQIMKSKYLRGKSPSPVRISIPKPRPANKPRGKALSASPIKRRVNARRVKSASARAGRGRLLYSNAQLMNMSPSSFLKLTAANKARATALRKGKAKAAANAVKARQAPAKPKAPSPPKRAVRPVPREVLRNAKFNRMVEKIWKNAGAKSGAEFNNAWHNARQKAIKTIQNRISNNKPPFSPSPPKPKAKTPSPPKPKARNNLPPPLSPLGPPPKPKANAKPARSSPNYKLSPSSGRAKIKSKNTGRWVYANLHFSMENLKSMAAAKGVNVKGIRSKAEIAKKLFS
jgi:serine/threonine protein kinase